MSTKTVDIRQEEGTSLRSLLSIVGEGNEIVLTEGDIPLARIVPFEPKRRIAGLHAGAVWTSDDFDEPLPEDFWVGAP